MKKILILLMLPCIIRANIVDKIVYNGKESEIEASISSNIKIGEELKLEDIDMLIDNFKYIDTNDVKVDIEPGKDVGYSSVYITNKKSYPFYMSLSMNNKGEKEEDGIYRYKLETGLKGFVLNERLDLSFEFVSPILPVRKEKEIDYGVIESDRKEKARLDNKLNLSLSIPIRDRELYFNYEYNKRLKSIEGNNDIYDILYKSDKYEIKDRIKLNKELKIDIGYIHKRSTTRFEDVLISEEVEHSIIGALDYKVGEYTLGTEIIGNISKNELDIDFSLEHKGIEFRTRLGKEYSVLSKYNLGDMYIKGGFDTNIFNYVIPNIVIGYRKNVERLSIDTYLEYKDKLKWLFNIKWDIF